MEQPAYRADMSYHRLHGLGKLLYKYQYTDEDLSRLKREIDRVASRETYVMFNNIAMRDDALRFMRLV